MLFNSFPFIGLAKRRWKVAQTAQVILVRPPRHHSALPLPGSAAAEHQEACRQAFDMLATSRPRTRFLDFLSRPLDADAEAFWDLIHYRALSRVGGAADRGRDRRRPA
jgi:hypothetical protein